MSQDHREGAGDAQATRGLRLTTVTARFCLLAVIAFTATILFSWQRKPFTNDDVVELVRAGFGEETILEAIRTNEPRFDTSAEALKALKNAGVSEKVIMAILAAGRAQGVPSAPSRESDALPADVGIYVLQDDKYIALEVEPVQWRERFGWTTTSGSMTRSPLNARLQTTESSLRLSGSPEFLIVCPEGVTAMEYRLLRAENKKDVREFRVELSSLAGGVHVALDGTGKSKVRFEAEKLVAGKFRVKPQQLAKGEYAFLPPSKSLEGKLYTFAVR